jgi:hypothetical protein
MKVSYGRSDGLSTRENSFGVDDFVPPSSEGFWQIHDQIISRELDSRRKASANGPTRETNER